MTAISDVGICNLALDLLGATRITSLVDNTRNAKAVNACYQFRRDRLMEEHPWVFAIQRFTLAPSSSPPPFGPTQAFPLPNGCMTVLFPQRTYLDWKIENNAGVPSILTSDGTSLQVRCVMQITDPTLFPPSFIEALAADIAEFICEEITQSNEKKAALGQRRKMTIDAAKRNNAIERRPDVGAEDTWVTAREIAGSDMNWLSGTAFRGI